MSLISSLVRREKPARKRPTLLALALAMSLGQTACGAGKGTAVSAPPARTEEVSDEKAQDMKIRISFGGKAVTATLTDGEAARDFVSLLPLTLVLEDHAGTEKISSLPRRLSTTGAPAGGDPSVGDVAYYAPWGNLAIYYKDFGYSSGLVTLGRLDGDVEALDAPGSIKATVELVK